MTAGLYPPIEELIEDQNIKGGRWEEKGYESMRRQYKCEELKNFRRGNVKYILRGWCKHNHIQRRWIEQKENPVKRKASINPAEV